MDRRTRISFLLWTLLAPGLVFAQAVGGPKHPPGTELYVTASGLALRTGPSTGHDRIHFIPQGERVTVLTDPLPPVAFEVDGQPGHWVRVKHGFHEGYVFDGFLSAQAPPLEDRLDWTCVPGERVGPITWQTTLDQLTSFFGPENVSEAIIYLGEGDSVPGTAIFKGTPNELLIDWAAFGTRPRAVIIEQEGTRWKTDQGVTIGTPLDRLVSLNNGPVGFAGFEWDYGGAVMDWGGGTLAESHTLGERLGLYLAATPPFDQNAYGEFIGDRTYRSNQPGARQLNLRVSKMLIRLNPIVPAGQPKPSHPLALADFPRPSPGDKRYVLADRLNMRAEPALNGRVLARLPANTVVTVLEDTAPKVPLVVDGIFGHWLKVQYHNMEGYAFDAYLLPCPGPTSGSEGLWGWARDVVGSRGTEDRQRTGDRGRGEERVTQTFNHGIRVEDRTWWGPGENGHATSVLIPGVALEQAYLLAVNCVPVFREHEFRAGADGSINLDTIDGRLMLRPEGQAVRITHAHTVKAR